MFIFHKYGKEIFFVILYTSEETQLFDYLQTQQMPCPFAQLPDAVPPYSRHSLLVKQVPFKLLLARHWEFAKRTTLNSGKTV